MLYSKFIELGINMKEMPSKLVDAASPRAGPESGYEPNGMADDGWRLKAVSLWVQKNVNH